MAAHAARIADDLTRRQFYRMPELEARYGASGRTKCRQDAEYHLSYLAQALRAVEPALFSDYVVWVKTMLAARGVPAEARYAQSRSTR